MTDQVTKRALSDDVFTSPIEAVARAMELGLGPQAHVHDTEGGQAVYMPGATHEAYLERMATLGAQVVDEDGQEVDDLTRVIEAIIGAVLAKAADRSEGVILKANDEERIVYGWASISTINGEIVVDKQGDVIRPATMEKAATRFMQSQRLAKAMHEGDQIGEVIHSLPLTKELQALLGVYSPIEGWVVAMKIHSDEVWKRVKSGELRAFSIGGKGRRAKYDN